MNTYSTDVQHSKVPRQGMGIVGFTAGAMFPGDSAGASLKLAILGKINALFDMFPGDSAGASLKQVLALINDDQVPEDVPR
jgi:hypothetical protein